MGSFVHSLLTKSRSYRSEKLLGIASVFIRLGLTANAMTLISFLLGLGAVYFLDLDHFWFVVLAALHLAVDGVDGVIARATKSTVFGKYFDHVSDQLIGILLLLKIAWLTQDYFVYIVVVLVFLSQLVYTISKLQSPAFFSRTILLLLLMIKQATLGFLAAGIIAVYTLASQLAWVLRRTLWR